MPSEELDPTTARLVSELAASIVPSLSKSLNSAVPVNDFITAIDRTNRTSQDLRSQIEKYIKSGIDENRAGRNVIIQSIGTVLDEILSLKRALDRIPESIEAALKNFKPLETNTKPNTKELDKISKQINELTNGIKAFCETYAVLQEQNASTNTPNEIPDTSFALNENNSRLDKLLNTSLPGLEGLVKAQSKSQTHELEEFSREISELQEQNNIALIHEVREALTEELTKNNNDGLNQSGSKNLTGFMTTPNALKIIMYLSGSCVMLLIIVIIMLFFK